MGPRLSKHVSVLIAALTILLLSGFFFFAPTWEDINHTISSDYPQVQPITTETLLKMLKQDQAPVIFDVRDKEEYDVSHLPEAILITDPTAVALPTNSHIVVYCSVGVRSAAFAAELMKRGFTKVFNLKGSIFEWANRGYPLVRDSGKPTYTVHPYNKKWGTLLNKELHQYHADR